MKREASSRYWGIRLGRVSKILVSRGHDNWEHGSLVTAWSHETGDSRAVRANSRGTGNPKQPRRFVEAPRYVSQRLLLPGYHRVHRLSSETRRRDLTKRRGRRGVERDFSRGEEKKRASAAGIIFRVVTRRRGEARESVGERREARFSRTIEDGSGETGWGCR